MESPTSKVLGYAVIGCIFVTIGVGMFVGVGMGKVLGGIAAVRYKLKDRRKPA